MSPKGSGLRILCVDTLYSIYVGKRVRDDLYEESRYIILKREFCPALTWVGKRFPGIEIIRTYIFS